MIGLGRAKAGPSIDGQVVSLARLVAAIVANAAVIGSGRRHVGRRIVVVVAPALEVEVDVAATVLVPPPTATPVVVDVPLTIVVSVVGTVELAAFVGVLLPQPAKPSPTTPVRTSDIPRRVMQRSVEVLSRRMSSTPTWLINRLFARCDLP